MYSVYILTEYILQHDGLEKIVADALQKFGVKGEPTDWALRNDKTGHFITEQVISQ